MKITRGGEGHYRKIVFILCILILPIMTSLSIDVTFQLEKHRFGQALKWQN